MKLNEKKFFELAKENGFESADLSSVESSSLSVSIFHGEIDSFTNNNSYELVARGIYKGKMGSISVDNVNKDSPEFLINEIKRTASIIENNDPVFIFKGCEKYHKKILPNKVDFSENIREKVGILFEIEKKLLAYDKRINEVISVGFEASSSAYKKTNSYGLKLSQKTNNYSYYAQISAKDGEEIRTGFHVFASFDENEFNIDEFVEKTAKDALQKLGSVQCESKKYPVVLNPDCVASLVSFLISSLDAEEVQKHSSLFIDKIGQKIASSKVTIEDKPLQKNVFARWFDDEGVATYNKPIIKNGVLQTYLYNLTTAAKAGVESTGNGYGGGSKKGISSTFLSLKPGKKSQEELFQEVGNGVFITDVSGLHAGLNPQSGNFSLQSTGFLIENGKKGKPLDLITVSGNLLEVFKDVLEVGNDVTVSPAGVSAESVLIKKLAVSGK